MGGRRRIEKRLPHSHPHLPKLEGRTSQPWGQLAADLPEPILQGESFSGVLTLHMTALVDLLDASRDGQHDQGKSLPIEDRLLLHERYYWQDSAESRGLWQRGVEPQRQKFPFETLIDALTAANALGARTLTEADSLLACVPALRGETSERREAVRSWISALYPSTERDAPWRTLEPDRLAERFLGRQLQRRPEVIDAIVPGAQKHQAEHFLLYYARAAAQTAFGHDLDEPLTGLCVRHANALGQSAVGVATRVEEPAPLLASLGHHYRRSRHFIR